MEVGVLRFVRLFWLSYWLRHFCIGVRSQDQIKTTTLQSEIKTFKTSNNPGIQLYWRICSQKRKFQLESLKFKDTFSITHRAVLRILTWMETIQDLTISRYRYLL